MRISGNTLKAMFIKISIWIFNNGSQVFQNTLIHVIILLKLANIKKNSPLKFTRKIDSSIPAP